MASASKIQLSLSEQGEFNVGKATKESAARASEVLQDNHDNHHIFFNKEGFHNHIAHHTLTLYALGASPEIIQKQYANNKTYQRPPEPVDQTVLQDMHDPARFHSYLGNGDYYHDFLVYFQSEIDKKGYEQVVNEYLLKDDERSNDLLVRTYAGFLHPMIHLGFGIEFKQPAIVAEALAQAAVHANWMSPLFLNSEKAAKEAGNPTSKTMVELLDEIRADKKLSTAAHWDDGNKVRDGILKRAPEEMINYASQWNVEASQLEEKTAEMTNAAIYYTGGAQHPPKQIKFDFYYMHCVNCSIFFSSFLKQPWLSTSSKVRLLEWKGRNDLALYASRRSPKPLLDEIVNYHPVHPSHWDGIFDRVVTHEDDGHASKLVRALKHGEMVSKPWQTKEAFRVKDGMWLNLGHMAIDSVEDSGDTWVRSAGFEEAWTNYEDRPRAQL